jgi:hypothetical protein
MKMFQLTLLHSAELQSIFDDQIIAMQGLIDEQLKIVQVAHAHETIVSSLFLRTSV